jgi:rubredoxin
VTRWKCRKCSYIYDPVRGDPDGGIAPGTPFSRIPDSWRCPVCGATKAAFYELAVPAAPPPPGTLASPSPPPEPLPVSGPEPVPPRPPPTWTVGSLKSRRQG